MESTGLEVTHRTLQETVVVQPTGILDVGTAATLRDSLLKLVAEQPRGVVVELSELDIPQHSVLSVFAVVWSRIREWPCTPLVLVADTPARRLLVRRSAAGHALPVRGSVSDAIDAVDDAPPRLRSEIRLPAALSSLAAARRFVTGTIAEWPVELDAATVELATMVANELVENTLSHTPVADLTLRLEWSGRWLHVAVADSDPNPAVLRDPQTTEGVRGLFLVAQACRAWGCIPRFAGGKVVWVTLPTVTDAPTDVPGS